MGEAGTDGERRDFEGGFEMLLYTKDPITGDHMVVDGESVIRTRTRAEALAICNERHEAERAAARSEQRR